MAKSENGVGVPRRRVKTKSKLYPVNFTRIAYVYRNSVVEHHSSHNFFLYIFSSNQVEINYLLHREAGDDARCPGTGYFLLQSGSCPLITLVQSIFYFVTICWEEN